MLKENNIRLTQILALQKLVCISGISGENK